MKAPARSLLRQLGSEKAADLAWRDMWAMITVKGGKLILCVISIALSY